jgi:hypothetical protein
VLGFPSPAAAQEQRVLFVLGDGDETIDVSESVREAVEAQLAGTDMEVVFARFEGSPATLRDQLAGAQALAGGHAVAATFWLEVTEAQDWFLYLAEPDAERILVRRIRVPNVASGTEAVGVITRRAATALFAGQTIGMQPVTLDQEKEVSPFEPPPAAPLAPVAPSPRTPRDALRIAAGYRGTTYSPELPWQHGVSVGAYWHLEGPYGGVALSSTDTSVVQNDVVTVDLTRAGGEMALGWRFGSAPLTLDLEITYAGEVVSRSLVGAPDGLVQSPPSRRWQSSAGGQVRGGLRFTRSIGAYAGLGLMVVLNDFQSIAIVDDETRVVLDPHKARWVGTVGLTVWP